MFFSYFSRILLVVVLLTSSSCSVLFGSGDEKARGSNGKQNSLDNIFGDDSGKVAQDIPLEVPAQQIELYHLRLGLSPENLDKYLIVFTETLKVQEEEGKSYYILSLKNLPDDKPVYFSVQAEDILGNLSEPTEVIELTNEE